MQLSFRDPDGFVFCRDGQIFRHIYAHAAPSLERFLGSSECREWMAAGDLVHSEILPSEEPDRSLLIRHAPIRFPNYPYEWAPEMLRAAAELTLRLAEGSLDARFGLKDATPYNVMFEGSKPVFIDLLSFEPMDCAEGLWRPYAQFARTFLYPLLASRVCGMGLDEIFVIHRDGLEPERMARMTPAWRLLTPPFFGLVALPALLSGEGGYQQRLCRDRGEAEFLLRRALARARKMLGKAAGTPGQPSATARYMETEQSYSPAEFQAKEAFVAGVLSKHRPCRVLDAGCNTGRFSMLAARSGASVVAIDKDASAIGLLWKRSAEAGADILPLVVDLSRPSPAVGWANGEAPSFLVRAEGKFDCVLMLALLHHLVVSERVPLDRVIELAARLTTDLLVIEYVDPDDAQFRRIARGREALHSDLTRSAFESAAESRFEILEYCDVSSTRRVYAMKKRGS